MILVCCSIIRSAITIIVVIIRNVKDQTFFRKRILSPRSSYLLSRHTKEAPV